MARNSSRIPRISVERAPQFCAGHRRDIVRSKDYAFSIRLHTYSQCESWAAISQYHTILLAAERLEEFHIHDQGERFAPYWDLLPKEHAPVLQSLKINMIAHLPTQVLSASKSILQHLSLDSCRLDWEEVRSLTGNNDLGIRNLLCVGIYRDKLSTNMVGTNMD